MISQAIISKIYDVAAIEEVVGEYVTLKRAGANYKGLCPFHDDKTPSMSVSPAKGIFMCFACQTGGDVFKFIMERESLSYPLAIKFLADKYHIEIEEGEIDVSELAEEARVKEGVYVTLEFAKNHFYQRLNESQDGKVIYKPYLSERGINQQSIDTFKIGLSGTSRIHLLEEGIRNGYTVQQLFDAGLVKKIDENEGVIQKNLRDTFVERIVFPIYNVAGKVLGFGGRIIKKDTKAPKYLNSPETVVYEKRRELFGLNFAKNAIRKLDVIYLVEGYMDVVSLSQNGIENVVAASGTAFTEEQARLIKRFTHNVTMLFDGDQAGVNASLKHISTLLKSDLNVRVSLFPSDEDPDSFIQKNGLTVFQEYIEKESQNFVELIASVALQGHENDPIKKAEAARTIAENIANIPDPLKRSAFINETSTILDIPARILIEETNKFRMSTIQRAEKEEQREQQTQFLNEPPIPEALVKDETNYQERDLLKSLILFADREFNEEKTVAAYIFEDLEASEVWPISKEYGDIFKEAFAYYNEHKVLNQLYFIRNPKTSSLAANAISTNYKLSTGWADNFEKFVKTDDDNYKQQVVQNLNYLKLKHIEILMNENQGKLKNSETEEDIFLYQNIHTNLQALRRSITEILGTVILG
jgi:DNA primase